MKWGNGLVGQNPSDKQVRMAKYEVNQAGLEYAHQLIEAKRYTLRSDWGDVQPSTARQNAYLERHPWPEYARWHLGLTVGAGDETKGRYAFVFGDFRRLHRSGLIACVYRAAEWRHKAVEAAAYELLQDLDRTAGIGAHE